ncbi:MULTISPECIES: TonB-dependent siderophore receptor [unclassified Pseudoalteromonas]|uniref:TonB-dependent siderophore receptor n=1 Tax=unclassified Pseudoalteromonas TaxID=194690 RepID=UPI0025B4C3D5|nr:MULTISPECIES: TonB-dependent siderophore receptor [unclassified Pseudoalteromonas]MDN3379662.1 TonB-dependent siderophore receptor [Pseudoalteromonas sp. APC 3893]MDN3388002.1 TonB-dependent siderophore receptor [Pseudoalteromonas sp. APC 4017]
MKRSALTVSVLTGLFSMQSFATQSIEKLEVQGTRTPLYSTRDVNASALGIKDPQFLPISIQSFSEELITNQRVKTLSEVLANDASVQNTAIGTVFDFVSLRGFQLDWTNGLRRDGLALAPYQDVPLENIQRIDIIKGPSSLVSGFNNPGGTINYVTKRPTMDSFLDITTEFRSRAGRYIHVDFGGPLDSEQTFGYRINAAAEKNGDFTGGDDLERHFFSAALDWQLSDRIFIRLDGDYQDKSTVSQPLIGLARDPNDDSHSVLPPYVDTSEILLGQPWAKYKTESFNIAARVDFWLNDNWQWVNQVALSGNDRFTIFPDIYSVDLEGNVLSASIQVTPDETYDTVSAHSFFTGQLVTAGIEHELVIGASIRDYQSKDGRWFELDNPVGNIFSPTHVSKPEFPEYPDPTTTDTIESSFFITDTLHFNDVFYATLGLRHIQYKKDQTAPNQAKSTLDDRTFNTPIIGLNYNPNDQLAFYASYSEGAGEGGVAVIGSGAINEGESLGPQESEQIEAGIKYQTDSMNYSVAVFEIEKMLEYHNHITNYFVQDGTQSHKGIELNASGSFIKGLSTVASITFMDPSLDELDGEPALNGNRPANVPKFQANLFLDYQLPFLENLSVNAGMFHVGEREQNVNNNLNLPAYTRFDLGAKYHFSDFNTTLRIKAENLFDKEYWLSGGAKGIDWGIAPGRGRTLIASLSVSF